MTISIPSFQTMSDTARAMKTALYGTDNKGSDPELCREKTKELYKLGQQLISAEIEGKIQLTDSMENSVLPIITEIEEVIAYRGFQDCIPLIKTLSKTYRTFIELRWYQPWRENKKMPVLTELRDQLIKTTKKLEKLTEKQGNQSIAALFEFRCAKKAARRLTPSENVWKKYAFHVASIGTASADLSFYDIWQALKAFAEDLKKDCPHKWSTWYQTVHAMRWDRLSIKTKEDFDKSIEPKIKESFEEGGNHALCLAKVSKELVKHGEDEAVRDRSFQVLTDLAQKEKIPGAHEIKHHPKEFVRKMLLKPDRFGETRILAMQYLNKIATNKKQCGNYEKYQKGAESVLKQRKSYLESNQGKKYQKEVQEISQAIQEICAERNKAKKRQGEIEPQIEEFENPTKNAHVVIEFATADAAITEWERLDGVAEEAQEKKEAIQKELDQINEISAALFNAEKKERAYLDSLLK